MKKSSIYIRKIHGYIHGYIHIRVSMESPTKFAGADSFSHGFGLNTTLSFVGRMKRCRLLGKLRAQTDEFCGRTRDPTDTWHTSVNKFQLSDDHLNLLLTDVQPNTSGTELQDAFCTSVLCSHLLA